MLWSSSPRHFALVSAPEVLTRFLVFFCMTVSSKALCVGEPAGC